MSLTPTTVDSPVIKVGAVVLRVAPYVVTGVRSASEPLAAGVSRAAMKGGQAPLQGYETLIIQPIPKNPGEVPPFVLPRGSRQYQDAVGDWHDARDVATGTKYASSLEPFTRALAREVAEEAGVTAGMLARAQVRALGTLPFQSRSKGVYPIHWFVVTLADADAAVLTDTVPADALASRWASLDVIKKMAARGEFSAGYVDVIAAALETRET